MMHTYMSYLLAKSKCAQYNIYNFLKNSVVMTCIVLGISCQHGWQTIPSWTEEKQFIWRLNIAEQYKHGDEPDVHTGTTTDSAQWTGSLHVSYLRGPHSLTSVYVLHRELWGGGGVLLSRGTSVWRDKFPRTVSKFPFFVWCPLSLYLV